MIKLAVFDLDGTLAPVGKPISAECVELLKQIEDCGIKVGVSSGKTIFYQIGMFRQVGLRNPIFMGENGSLIAFGSQLPPKVIRCINADDTFFKSKNKILNEISVKFEDKIWLQPNEVMLTLFFKDSAIRDFLREYFEENKFKNTLVYEHIDSFDVVPLGISKKKALELLSSELNIKRDEMIAVGDGMNDIPMFEYCKFSIGLDKLDNSLTTFHFATPEEALKHILRIIKNDKQI